MPAEVAATRKPRWHADWRMTLFVVLMLPLVVGLGIWQLQRAAYKQALMDAYLEKLGGLPVRWNAPEAPAAFMRLRLEGRYLPMQVLLDNQIRNSQPGYWAYALFRTDTDTWLVNRGWHPAPRLRSALPAVPSVPAGEVELVALVWPDTGMLPLFGEPALSRVNDSTIRLQRFDVAALRSELERTAALELPLRPLELRLEAGQPGVLEAAPQSIGFGVERHQGYALQWFGLAIALVVGFYIYGRKPAPARGHAG